MSQELRSIFADGSLALTVANLLTKAGHKAFCVGGAVRDALLGNPFDDVDVATDAFPAQVRHLAEDAGLKVKLAGFAFGSIKIIRGLESVDVTTLRRDIYADDQLADVEFADSLAEDASRRDFTINALYSDVEGALYDPLNGIEDLKARRVRFIGCPKQRIDEDPIRILRFFRTHAFFASPERPFDKAVLAAIAQSADKLRRIKRERMGEEILKLLSAPRVSHIVRAMEDSGVLSICIQKVDTTRISALERLEARFDEPPDPLRRLALLGVIDPKDSFRIRRSMARRIETFMLWMRKDTSMAELGYRLKTRDAVNVALLRSAISGRGLSAEFRQEIAWGANQVCPVRPVDFIESYPILEVMNRFQQLERRWLDSGFQLTRDQLLAD